MIKSFADFGVGGYENDYQGDFYNQCELSSYGYLLSLFYDVLILYVSNMHALYSHEILCKYSEHYLLCK
jgi:hypothetical protein